MRKVKSELEESFSYLAGNALNRDKKGRVKKVDASMESEIAAAGADNYSPFVYYEFGFE